MSKIQLSITNSKELSSPIPVIFFEIKEKEGEPPTALIKIPFAAKHRLKGNTEVTLMDNNSPLFEGKIEQIIKKEDTVELVLGKENTQVPINSPATDPELIKLLYDNEQLEIPEVFCKLNVPFFDRIKKDVSTVSLVVSQEKPLNLDRKIIKGSLKKEKNFAGAIPRVDLEISCSWMSCVEGEVDISNKISQSFTGEKINTLTPNSLEASWPRFGDRLPGIQNARQSKYSVGFSRLLRENPLHMLKDELATHYYNIDKDTTFQLRRHWFNTTFSICYFYEQYRREIIKTTINNKLCRQDRPAKKIKINLHSVQEFLDNDSSNSFFRSPLGRKAYKYILKNVSLFMALSMRDSLFSFSIPYSPDISCKSWINIQGRLAKVTSLKFNSNDTIDVKAMGFSKPDFHRRLMSSRDLITMPTIEEKETQKFGVNDVIQDVVVENDSYAQASAVDDFLQRNKGKITKENFQQQVNNFLNKNKTLITVITKPLKTKYCEQEEIFFPEMNIANTVERGGVS